MNEYKDLEVFKMNTKTVLVGFLVIFLLSSVSAAALEKDYEAKNSPPAEVIDAVEGEVISMGLSKDYFKEHFSLKYANVDSASSEGWESISIDWDFNINEEFSVAYQTKAYKVTESFIATKDYVIKDEIAYLFPTNSLHEFERLISKVEAEKKLGTCLGVIPETSLVYLSKDGGLFLTASIRKDDNAYEGMVNLETGEITCSGPKYLYEDVEQEPGPKGQGLVKGKNIFQKFWAWLKSLFD